jgi:hypothetical protein
MGGGFRIAGLVLGNRATATHFLSSKGTPGDAQRRLSPARAAASPCLRVPLTPDSYPLSPGQQRRVQKWRPHLRDDQQRDQHHPDDQLPLRHAFDAIQPCVSAKANRSQWPSARAEKLLVTVCPIARSIRAGVAVLTCCSRGIEGHFLPSQARSVQRKTHRVNDV